MRGHYLLEELRGLRIKMVRQQTLGVPPASTVCIHVRSMFCPVKMTAARRPCSRPRSSDSAANTAAPDTSENIIRKLPFPRLYL